MKNKMNKLKVLLTALLVIGSVVNGVIITVYNVDKSSNVGKIVSEINKLSDSCNSYTEKISVADSLSSFFEKSKIYGYEESSRILYFNQPGSVAQAR
jgi:hypothetical protein